MTVSGFSFVVSYQLGIEENDSIVTLVYIFVVMCEIIESITYYDRNSLYTCMQINSKFVLKLILIALNRLSYTIIIIQYKLISIVHYTCNLILD